MSEVNPIVFMSVINTLLLIVLLANGVRQFLGKDKAPQPFMTKEAVDYCPLLVHEQHRKEVATGFAELGSKIEHVEDNRRVSVSKVYEFTRAAMESQRKETKADIAQLRGEIKSDFAGVHDRLTDLIKQLPRGS